MTSKERILKVFRGEIPDRVPIHIGFNSFMGGMREVIYRHESFRESLAYMDQHTDIIVQMTPKFTKGLGMFLTATESVEKEITKWSEGKSTYIRTIIHTPKGDLQKLERIDEDVATVWHLEHVIKTDDDIERFLSIPYVEPDPDVSDIRAKIDQIGDRGMVFISLLDPIREVNELMAFDEFMIRCATDIETIYHLMDIMHQRVVNIQRQILHLQLSPVIVLNGIEYATPPYVSRANFESFMTRYYIDLVDDIHQHQCWAYIHSHGRVGTILDEMLRIGIDALHPVEAPPGGDILLADAKRILGNRVVIAGNIQFGDLETLNEDQIESIVRDAMLTGKEGGRFIIATSSSAIKQPLDEQMAKNYLRAVETALRYGSYN